MILITGASGFIGKHLTKFAINHFGKSKVILLTSKPQKYVNYILHNDYNFDENYIINNLNGAQIDAIIHAGAFTPKDNMQSNNLFDCNSNIINTDKLLKSFLPNLKKIIYLSTLDVYGNEEIITEKSKTAPTTLYGESKLYVEKMISNFAKDKEIVHQTLRIGHVFGPGEESYAKLIPIVFKKILTKKPIKVFGSGNAIRTYIYIEDVVEAVFKSLKLETFSGVINIVGSNKISVIDLIQKMILLSGENCKIEKDSGNITERDLIFDNSKMVKSLQIKETPIDKGLLAELNYLKNENIY